MATRSSEGRLGCTEISAAPVAGKPISKETRLVALRQTRPKFADRLHNIIEVQIGEDEISQHRSGIVKFKFCLDEMQWFRGNDMEVLF